MSSFQKNITGKRQVEDSACRLTVVVPVYNRAGRVAATLDSLEAQTLRPLRVVLVDNNSTDDTLRVLLDWKSRVESPSFVVTVVEEKRPGAAAARNRGLAEVTTPFTMFFDSDDLMAQGHCLRALSGFDDNPGADIVGWDCSMLSLAGRRNIGRFSDRDVLWDNIFYGSMATQRYAARTALFRQAGGWNPECRGWDDVELGARLLGLSPKIVKLNGSQTVEIVASADSITGDSFSAKASVWEHALDLMEASCGNPRVARYVNFRRAILAGDYRRERAVDDSRRQLGVALSKEPSRFFRMLARLAVVYRGIGLPGISRILRPFFG